MVEGNKRIRFVLGVAAGKGGVGKSTLTVNLALALQEIGWRVGILDADLYGPSLSMMLPPQRFPQPSPADPQRMIPAMSQGIESISFSYFSDSQEAAMVRAPIANGLMKQFLHQVAWSPLDCLLVDFPPGTGDIQLTLIQEGELSAGVVVSTPQEVALLDVGKAIKMFDHMNVPIVGIVENMSYFQDLDGRRHYPFGQEGAKRLASTLGIPFLGEIPLDPAVSSCGDHGRSLFDQVPAPASVEVFRQIAALVKEQLEAFSHLEGDVLKNFEVVWQTSL